MSDTTFAKGDEKGLAAELLTLSGVVLVSWEHKAIIEGILPQIPVARGTPPGHWPDQRFDVVLRFDRPDGKTKFAFRPLYPKLLLQAKLLMDQYNALRVQAQGIGGRS